MNQGPDRFQQPINIPDPYECLGVAHDASFEDVQIAKQNKLSEIGNDDSARSKIESAYDSVLMNRLKDRQQGHLSHAAKSASQREQVAYPAKKTTLTALPTALSQLTIPKFSSTASALPSLSLAIGSDFWFPLGTNAVLLAMLLFTTASPEVLLALATFITVLNLQRRNGRLWPAVGWSFALLFAGLILGSILSSPLASNLPTQFPLNQIQLQSLPAFLLMLLGALFII